MDSAFSLLAKSSKKEVEVVSLEEMFTAYCRLDPISFSKNLKLLPLSQSDKWMRSANILDMQRVTTTDTGKCFFKFRKRAISFQDFLEYLEDLAESRNLDIEDMKYKMQTCGKPLNPFDIKEKEKKKL